MPPGPAGSSVLAQEQREFGTGGDAKFGEGPVEMVAARGIGAAHDGPTPTFESLSAALRTALTPETSARAKAVAGTIRADGAAVAAKLLLDVVSGERPRLI